jgi:hypothetical protein
MRALLCTFGFDEDKIIKAMRHLKHERLIIFTGSDNTQLKSYDKIVDLCRLLKTPMETILVEKFNLIDCILTISEKIASLKDEGWEIGVNISGGLPLLSDAALLAAFNSGIEAYYMDDVLIQLPTLKGVTIKERLNREQRNTLCQVGKVKRLDDIRPMTGSSRDVRSVLLELKNLNLVRVDFDSGSGFVSCTDQGKRVHEWLSRTDR